jgi:AraC family transcriptional regulator
VKNLFRIESVVDYIEDNLDKPITLDEIANRTSMSMFYLIRLFNMTVEESIMEYVRKRRLTRASRELVDSDTSIIDISLDCCYKSQEAFTRAFKRMFGMTAARYRKRGIPIATFERQKLDIRSILANRRFMMREPKVKSKDEFMIAGLKYQGRNEHGEIPAMWQRFIREYEEKKQFACGPCFGVCDELIMDESNRDYGSFSYYAGMMIKDISDTPDEMMLKIIPAMNWLIFEHKGKLGTLDNTYNYIYKQFIPDSRYEPAGIDVEMYDERFIPDSEDSVFEIWIGIK